MSSLVDLDYIVWANIAPSKLENLLITQKHNTDFCISFYYNFGLNYWLIRRKKKCDRVILFQIIRTDKLEYISSFLNGLKDSGSVIFKQTLFEIGYNLSKIEFEKIISKLMDNGQYDILFGYCGEGDYSDFENKNDVRAFLCSKALEMNYLEGRREIISYYNCVVPILQIERTFIKNFEQMWDLYSSIRDHVSLLLLSYIIYNESIQISSEFDRKIYTFCTDNINLIDAIFTEIDWVYKCSKKRFDLKKMRDTTECRISHNYVADVFCKINEEDYNNSNDFITTKYGAVKLFVRKMKCFRKAVLKEKTINHMPPEILEIIFREAMLSPQIVAMINKNMRFFSLSYQKFNIDWIPINHIIGEEYGSDDDEE